MGPRGVDFDALVERFVSRVPDKVINGITLLGIKKIDERFVLYLLTGATFVLGVFFFILFQFFVICYGRYSVTARKHYGKLCIGIKSNLAWFLQEVPAFLVSSFVLANEVVNKSANVTWIKFGLASLYTIHYFHRSFIYPLQLKGGKPTPVILWVLAFVYCTVQGYLQPRGIFILGTYDNDMFSLFRITIGVLLFITGLAINAHSDYVLINLRKPGEIGYKIPRGGMFEYVSGANFFGEIVEWLGFAIAANTISAMAFSFFTVCVIFPRACHHHRWYKEKFEDYPRNRKAVIPFVL